VTSPCSLLTYLVLGLKIVLEELNSAVNIEQEGSEAIRLRAVNCHGSRNTYVLVFLQVWKFKGASALSRDVSMPVLQKALGPLQSRRQ
jgi:hypothetical protein